MKINMNKHGFTLISLTLIQHYRVYFIIPPVVGRLMPLPSKNVHILILEACEYVTLHRIKFAHGIKVSNQLTLKYGFLGGYLGGPNRIKSP